MAHAATTHHRMSDAEALMWRLEKDPALSSTVAMVTVLDRPPDLDRLRRRMERAVQAVPRLRQKVQPSPALFTPPTWVDDPDFDLAFHLRHVALPQPGSMRQLLDHAALLAADPFDRTRPLWEFVVVDGLEGGRSALLQKLHHTITDGEGGIRLSMQFLDLERDAAEPPPLDDQVVSPVAAPPAPTPLDAVRDLVTGGLRMPLGAARQARDLLASPAQLPAAGMAAVSSMKVLASQLGDTERARSPLWTARSLRRRVEILRVPFESTKDAAKRLGGTLNTAFVTAAAEAAGAYHRELGAPVDTLRTSMAVSTRTETSGANAFGLVRLDAPTADMPIVERFRLVQDATTAARGGSTTGNLELLAALVATLPTSLVTRIARTQAQTVDFATSNVRAAPFPLFIAGAKILQNHPIGPTAGVAFNLTLMSYDGSLDIGVNVDAAAVEDPARLVRLLDAAFEQLRAAG